MDKFCVFLFVLSLYSIINAGSGGHSLRILFTCITGKTPFPEFTAVLMLDDVQVGYYDSITKNVFFSREETNNLEKVQEGNYVMDYNYISMRERFSSVKQSFNLTKGVHVYQRIAGCEMMDNGETALMRADACDGIDADTLLYNLTKYMYFVGNTWQLQFSKIELTYFRTLADNVQSPRCMKALNYFLEKEKKVVLRKVRPRVRFIEKTVPGGAEVSCLATDFYPRHINLTLLRDGQPVAEQELTGGTVLPNGNGLYQVRKTLDITTEELRERHNYTCTASHLSLDNKLDISWQPELSHEHNGSILLAILVIMVLIGITVIVLGIVKCVRRVCKPTDSRTFLQPSAHIDSQVMEHLNPSTHSDT